MKSDRPCLPPPKNLEKNIDHKKLKMFVWNNVLHDCSAGMICVLAHSLEEAHVTAKRDLELYESGTMQYEPDIIAEVPMAVRIWGSS